MNRVALAVFATVSCSAMLVAGCRSSQAPSPEASATESAEAKSGVVLTGLRIVMPRVVDHPAVLYFTLKNAGASQTRLVGVFVDGATRSDMHETTAVAMKPLKAVDIAPGETMSFAPGGRHVMLFGVPGTWKPGDHPAVTLTFADADKISGKAVVQKGETADMGAEASDATSGMKM